MEGGVRVPRRVRVEYLNGGGLVYANGGWVGLEHLKGGGEQRGQRGVKYVKVGWGKMTPNNGG